MSARGRNTAEHQQDAVGAYDTPLGVCRALWAEIERREAFADVTRILEPHVGAGNWLRTMPESWRTRGVEVEVMDVDPLAPGIEEASLHGWEVTPSAPAQSLVRSGFLVTEPRVRPDAILGNPPYSVVPPRIHCPWCEGWIRVETDRVLAGVKGSGVLSFCTMCDGAGRVQPPAVFVTTNHLVRALRLTRRHVVFLLRVGFVGSAKRLPLFRRIRPRHEWRLFPRPRFKWGGSDASEYSILHFDVEHSRRHPQRQDWTTSVLEWKND